MHRVIANAKQKRIRKQTKKPVIKIAGWIIFFIIILSLLATLASIHMAKKKGETPGLLGFQLYKIESGSMAPVLPVGAVILSRRPADASQLQEQDIVTFETTSGAIVTHRIIKVLTDDKGNVRYRTKGDNPISSPDLEMLTPNRVIAVFITKIPFT
ncbi:MAG: signal peptidase I [Firmicutes bacterium]|nr:signal peptidase I [Bacillota bacterium]